YLGRVGRELAADQACEVDALPAILAEQRVGGGHGLDATVEGFDELVHRAAALPAIHRDHANTREHVLDAMVQLGDQQVLMLLGPLALSNVEGQALEAHKASCRVELGT